MTAFAHNLLKLGPANPILLRVVTAGGRRWRHAFTRWIYLGLLIGVLLVALLGASPTNQQSLSDLAKASTQVFKYISFAQLAMICLLAPVFTAGAITQERDSQTYNILLATPLTNSEILLGSLFSRLYYVVALLLSGLPVFAITLFYGGVTGVNIALSAAIAMTTGLFTGAVAMAIAVFRLGTGKTVFWFYVFNVVYLVGLYIVDRLIGVDPVTLVRNTTILTGIHPFLALEAIVNPTSYVAPDLAALSSWPRIFRWYLAYPAYSYVALTLLGSLAVLTPSALVLRRVAQQSDVGFVQYLRHLFKPREEVKGRRARHVWTNPVAWREAATRAGVSVRGVARWATVLVGALAAIVLLYFHHYGKVDGGIDGTRKWLVGLVTLEFSVALLVATNTSASAVTRERESRTLDLLLVTPITSRYYIWGKLRGLVSFMLPFAAVPTLTVLVVMIYDVINGTILTNNAVVFPEVLLAMPLFLTVIIAWACMLGLQLSLKWTRTIVAVMASVGVLAGIAGVLGICGFTMAAKFTVFGIVVGSFSPFTAVAMMLDPMEFARESFLDAGGLSGVSTPIGRLVMFCSILVSCIVYCSIVWAMYRSMVRNFDMIIRKQHQ